MKIMLVDCIGDGAFATRMGVWHGIKTKEPSPMCINSSIGTFVSSITLLVGALVMIFISNVQMALAAVLSSLLGFVLLKLLVGKSQKYFSQAAGYLSS